MIQPYHPIFLRSSRAFIDYVTLDPSMDHTKLPTHQSARPKQKYSYFFDHFLQIYLYLACLMFDFFRCFFEDILKIRIDWQFISYFEWLWKGKLRKDSIFGWVIIYFCFNGIWNGFQFSNLLAICCSNKTAERSSHFDFLWKCPDSVNLDLNWISSCKRRLLELFYKKLNGRLLILFSFFIAHLCL